ncbi:MAG: 16S rRNA (cytidine(1402)-2'-O)-methyltransferase [Bacilli bacterium]|nr:16S rRNA (cytidine(1402)-2'-O)-methyltransferase [Bacilli bacterium]
MGNLYVVATPIGNLQDITLRALDVLRNVDYIACEDTRQTIKLLNHYEIKKKLVAYHKFNELSKSNFIIDDLKKGMDIAIVTDAGTPCISDPGYILIRKAREEGINVFALPGASAVVSALSVSGIDTTNFAFIGFLPTDNTKFNEEIDRIKDLSINTFVLYESPKRIVKLFNKLTTIFESATVYIASDLTKIHERGFYGKIEDVYEQIKNDANIEKGEYAIVIEKKDKKVVEEGSISIEAMIVDTIVKNNCSVKEAIKKLNENNKKLKKNDIYEASLKLKDLLGGKNEK